MNRKSLGIIAVALAAAIGAFLVVQHGDSSKKAATRSLAITVKDGAVVGGKQSLTVNKGDTVKLTVISDVAAEVHVHGVEVRKDVPAGGTIELDFKASVDGVFPIELHSEPEIQLAKLTINP